MSDTLLILAALLGALALGMSIGWAAGFKSLTLPQAIGMEPVEPAAPRIVVNVPPNWTPAIPPMPETELSGARAHLWYAVYSAALDDGRGMWSESDATAAVEACFGPLAS